MIRSRVATSPRPRGFTLIEVLAALVLVGIVLPVAMRGITLSMQAATRARHLSQATEVAQLKLTELVLLNDTSALAGAGEIENNGATYSWSSRAVSRDYGLYEIAVEVGWVSGGRAGSTTVSTLFYPSAATSTESTATSGEGSP